METTLRNVGRRLLGVFNNFRKELECFTCRDLDSVFHVEYALRWYSYGARSRWIWFGGTYIQSYKLLLLVNERKGKHKRE